MLSLFLLLPKDLGNTLSAKYFLALLSSPTSHVVLHHTLSSASSVPVFPFTAFLGSCSCSVNCVCSRGTRTSFCHVPFLCWAKLLTSVPSVWQVHGILSHPLQCQHRLHVWEECQLLWHRGGTKTWCSPAPSSQNHYCSDQPCWPGLFVVPGNFPALFCVWEPERCSSALKWKSHGSISLEGPGDMRQAACRVWTVTHKSIGGWLCQVSGVCRETRKVEFCVLAPKFSLCFPAPACSQRPCGTQLHLLPSDLCKVSGPSGTAQPAKPMPAPWLVFNSPRALANILPLWAGRRLGNRGCCVEPFVGLA